MLECQSDKFDLPEEVSYINCAYMSPLLKSSMEEGIKGVARKGRPFAITPADFFNQVREIKKGFGKLVNGDPERMAIIPSLSHAMATITSNLRIKEKNVLIIDEQFPSNVYPWKRWAGENNCKLITIEPPAALENRHEIWNEKILEQIDINTGIVSMGTVHWADGTLFDVKKIRERTREVGAYFFLDGTQSVGALPFDIQEVQPDALVCSGYKWLLFPYTTGMAYFSEVFDDAKPLEENWVSRKNSDNFAGLVNYQDDYREKGFRFSMGETSNWISLPMGIEALRQLNEWGPANIQHYCRSIVNDKLEALQDRGYLWGSDGSCGAHLFGIRMPEGVDINILKQRLEDQKVYVSIRGNAIRVSPHVYNTENDIDKLVSCMLE